MNGFTSEVEPNVARIIPWCAKCGGQRGATTTVQSVQYPDPVPPSNHMYLPVDNTAPIIANVDSPPEGAHLFQSLVGTRPNGVTCVCVWPSGFRDLQVLLMHALFWAVLPHTGWLGWGE